MKKFNLKLPKFLLGIPVALLSVKIFFGGIFGYFVARFLSEKLNSVILSIGSYELHFHHWIMGVIGLGAVLIYQISPLIEQLFFGFFGGLIFQGISSYSDWHRIFVKKH